MSYSSRDKRLAGQIKTRLEEFGITAFVAHDDIPGGSMWANSIRESISDCRLFLALITKTYHEQEYTEQELGMAVYAKKPVVCISVDDAQPLGFARLYQHIRHHTNQDLECLRRDILDAVLQEDQAEKIDLAIACLAKSNRFDDSNSLAKHLDEGAHLSESQARRLAGVFVNNDQIYYARHFAGKHILSILIRHVHYLDEEIVAKIKDAIKDIDWYKEQVDGLQWGKQWPHQSIEDDRTEDDWADAEVDRELTFRRL